MDKTTNQDQWEHGLDLIRQAGLEGEPAADSSTPWFAAEDLYRAPIGGVTHFGESLLDLGTKPLNAGIWAYNKLTDDNVNYLQAPDLLGDFDESRSHAGHLVSGITQFALSAALGTKLLEGLGVAAKIGQGGKVLSSGLTGLARTAAVDTTAGFIGFKGDEGRLADLLNAVPSIRESGLNYLASSPDDNWAEARLKTALEGTGIGLLTHGVLSLFKSEKKLTAALKSGKKEAIEAAYKARSEAAEAYLEALREQGKIAVNINSEQDMRQFFAAHFPEMPAEQVEEVLLNVRRRAEAEGISPGEALADHMGVKGIVLDAVPGEAAALEKRVFKPYRTPEDVSAALQERFGTAEGKALFGYLDKDMLDELTSGTHKSFNGFLDTLETLQKNDTGTQKVLIDLGAAAQGGYEELANFLKAHLPPDMVDQWGRLNAILSPQTEATKHTKASLSLLADFYEFVSKHQRAPNAEEAGILYNRVQRDFGLGGPSIAQHKESVIRLFENFIKEDALITTDLANLVKTPSFNQNSTGKLTVRGTFDTWSTRSLKDETVGFDRKALVDKGLSPEAIDKAFKGHLDSWVADRKNYVAMNLFMRGITDKLGIAVAEGQERQWSATAAVLGLLSEGVKPKDILAHLNHADVRTIWDPLKWVIGDAHVRNALKRLGVSDSVLAAYDELYKAFRKRIVESGPVADTVASKEGTVTRVVGDLAQRLPGKPSGAASTFLGARKSRLAGETSKSLAEGSRFAIDAGSGGRFYDSIRNLADTHEYGAAVEVKSPEFYTDPRNRLYMSPDGKAGAVVTYDGDLVSVFKHPDSATPITDILADATKKARTLDGFDINGKLQDLYGKYGFRPAARLEFNPEFAPANWKPEHGTPDVVLMVKDTTEDALSGLPEISKKNGGYAAVRDQVPLFKSFEEAANARDAALKRMYPKIGAPPSTLFQERGVLKGAVAFMDDGSAVLHVFTGATDVSTLEHELAHVWRRRLAPEDLEAVGKALGVPAGQQWSRETEEAFANQYEAWLAGTKASPELESAFGKYKQWMADAYRDVVNSPLGEKVNPELAKFFESRYGDALANKPRVIPEAAMNQAMDSLVANLGKNKDLSKAAEELGQNLSKWLVDKDVQQAFTEIAEAAKARMTSLRGGFEGVESLKMTSDFADVLGTNPENVLGFFRQYAGDAHQMAAMQTAGRSLLQGMSEQVLTAARRVQSEGSNAARVELLQWAEKLSNFYADLTAVQTGHARATSAGRIARDAASPQFTPSRIEEAIKSSQRGGGGRTGGGPGTGTGGTGTGTGGGPGTGTGGTGTGTGGGIRRLPGAKIAEIISGGGGEKGVDQLADLIIKAVGPDGLEGNGGAAKALNRVLVRRNNVTNALIEWRMNAMLSSPKTLAVNQLSNAVQVLLQPAEKIVGGVLTANPESIKQGFAIYGATARYFRESLTMARRALMSGDSLLDSFGDTKLAGAISSQAFGASNTSLLGQAIDALGTATRMPTRLMMTSEEFFKQLNYRAFLHQDIMERALARFKDPQDIARFFAEQWEASFDKLGRGINDDAMAYARNATFSTPLTYGVGKSLQEMVVRNPWMRLVLPFVKTPTNLIRNVWAHTPLLGAFQRQWAEDFAAGGVRRSQAVGKWAVGGLIFGTAATYAIDGVITGGGPSDPDAKKTKLLSGWQPYSIVTTGPDGKKQYVSFNRLDPGGMMLGLAADIVEAGAEIKDGDYETLAGHAISAVAKNLTSKSYLMSLSDALAVLEDPDRRAERYMQKLAASFVPRGLDTVNGDPYLREAVTIMDGVRARVPGLSDKLSARRNLFGEKMPVGQAFGPDFISPFAFSKEVPDDVNQELGRLGRGFSLPDHRVLGLDLRTLKNEKGQDAYDRLMELVGSGDFGGGSMKENLAQLVRHPRYQALPDVTDGVNPTGRTDLIGRVVHQRQAAALAQVRREFPQINDHILSVRREKALGKVPRDILAFVK